MDGRSPEPAAQKLKPVAKTARTATIDANEAVARVAYKTNEVCIIYPITPASPMGEHADQWATQGEKNLWGVIPDVTQMQSEAGAAGSVHGALQTGALTTTFTASQGLLLMIPNMYKIAGELTPTVFHIASRSIAAQALSIFGDHQDVMAARQTGFAMLCSPSVQAAQDFAVISQAVTLESRVPFVHFFDGFRTSHEINTIELVEDEQIAAMIDQENIHAHRKRALNPEHAFIRGTAQNPDIYFQARETVNPYYDAVPGILRAAMDRFATLTGRQYALCEYHGAPDAERIIVTMGSSAEVVEETIDFLSISGNKLGVIKMHLYRPFPAAELIRLIPKSCKSIAVLDRTKEPGSGGEPLYKDVVTALTEAYVDDGLACEQLPRVIGGRYGLSSKDFTPAMAKAVFDELEKDRPKNHFTVGIIDDVTHTSIDVDHSFVVDQPGVFSAMFYGQGGDGTVGSNKNTVQIIGQGGALQSQAFFYYDSKKAGSQTISHLRFGPDRIEAPYYIQKADFVACHLFSYLEKMNVLEHARQGATFLMNTAWGPDEVWDKLARDVQREIIERELKVYVIDAYKVAGDAGLGRRTSTVMQTCFFAISGVLPKDEAIEKIKEKIHKTFIRKGEKIVEMNYNAVDMALANLHRVVVPQRITSPFDMPSPVKPGAPKFVRDVIGPQVAGRGDMLPVSMLPVDGTYPSGTTAWEIKDLTQEVPVWEPEICAQCGNCELVCPHAVIRMKTYDESALAAAPEEFKSIRLKGRGVDSDQRYTLQIAVDSCTGCGLCVAACPVEDNPAKPNMKAINMGEKAPILAAERENWDFFQELPQRTRGDLVGLRMRESQLMQPTFEFSGACAGCGETPYLKLLTQIFGDHLYVANATGCSSIFGGNQPTTPWSTDADGRGPAWANSLFEDNAEFGYGFRVTLDKLGEYARRILRELSSQIGEELVGSILNARQLTGSEIEAQRVRLNALREQLTRIADPRAKDLYALADHLLDRVVWIVGGDGWAYDIGFGGLDHVLANDRDVNILVMDTEVYSNTGGQRSKATPRAATAKFATGGKAVAKKDLGMIAVDYGHVYVAQIAFGADPKQTVRAMQEAAAHKGPSILISYATCIAHGFDLTYTVEHMRTAVNSGYWPLYRFDPRLREVGRNPMQLDSGEPTVSFRDYALTENRYRALEKANPAAADELMEKAQADIAKRWQAYQRLADGVEV